MTGQTLVVWDFDWSMCEENTDTYVIQQIGAASLYRQLREQGLPWTQLMDATLAAAAAELGVKPSDIQAALHSVPIDAGLVKWLRNVGAATRSRASSTAAAEQQVEMVTVSDANSHYISELLAHHGLADCFTQVHTNPADFKGGALRVAPYHAQPHGCPRCPRNLCKGQVVQQLLEQRRASALSQIVYVGDGRGDYCPCAHLLAAGSTIPATVLARTEYPDGQPCSLWVMLTQAGAPGTGSDASDSAAAPGRAENGQARMSEGSGGAGHRVRGWSTPAQLVALLQECIPT